MAKKNFWYVIVISGKHPKFVTRVDNENKMCFWENNKKPRTFINKEDAVFTANALSFNGNCAFAVCSNYELSMQTMWADDEDIEDGENEAE